MRGEMDFSDRWFRKRFRDELSIRNFQSYSESLEESFIRLAVWLQTQRVVLSSSGKMAYDRNGRVNSLRDMYWNNREQFVDWARATKQPIFKKRTRVEHEGPVTAPRPKPPAAPKKVGWDDFDWSR